MQELAQLESDRVGEVAAAVVLVEQAADFIAQSREVLFLELGERDFRGRPRSPE